MVAVQKEGIVISGRTLAFEADGVLNPAVIIYNHVIHVFYRAVGKGNYSTIGYCSLEDPLTVKERFGIPVLFPQFDYESHGIEDPRIVRIDDIFYLTYTAYDGVNALGALAVSKDLIHFEKKGIIVPMMAWEDFRRLADMKGTLNKKYSRYNNDGGIHEKRGRKVFVSNKDVVFFPRRINGKLYFLQRIKPDVQIVAVSELEELTTDFWQNYFLCHDNNIVLHTERNFEISYLGGGCPPIETAAGWILIYHGVHDGVDGYVYSACAALLDIENPQKVIATLPHELFKPEMPWELKGEVNNVVFPTGAVVIDDLIYIYYGAADQRIGCATVSLSALLEELLLNAR
jgi:beta-1,2-mannobiose phosphorylase / 1,2-beta-oligomannan phosphorylase